MNFSSFPNDPQLHFFVAVLFIIAVLLSPLATIKSALRDEGQPFSPKLQRFENRAFT